MHKLYYPFTQVWISAFYIIAAGTVLCCIEVYCSWKGLHCWSLL